MIFLILGQVKSFRIRVIVMKHLKQFLLVTSRRYTAPVLLSLFPVCAVICVYDSLVRFVFCLYLYVSRYFGDFGVIMGCMLRSCE